MKLLFSEKQKFTQWWLWLLLIVIAIAPFYEILKHLLTGEDVLVNTVNRNSIVLPILIIIVTIGLFILMTLKTEIDENELRMSFFPFTKKHVKWSEVKSVRILKYGFVGGWGIRFFTPYGTVYNTKGNKGLVVELKNEDIFLIGTQKEAELTKVIEKLRAEGKF